MGLVRDGVAIGRGARFLAACVLLATVAAAAWLFTRMAHARREAPTA